MENALTLGEEEDYKIFLASHTPALKAAGIPPIYWRSLHYKLSREVFDAGEVFGVMREEEEEEEAALQSRSNRDAVSYKVIVTRESGLQACDPASVYLVDHAWTYRVENARQQLQEIPGLLGRMAALMGLPFHGEVPDAETVDLVLDNMWKFNQTYQLSQGSAEEKVPVWYIMDEFGSQVLHSSRPSCCMAPLFYAPQQIAYTVLWPLQDLEHGDEVTRDYTYGEPDSLVRKCRLLPWLPADLEAVSDETPEPPDLYYETILHENKEKLPANIPACTAPAGKVLKVYTETKQVFDHLKHPCFQFTENEDEADILWMYSHIRDYRKLSMERPHILLNQFPCETVLTTKDCLASVSRRARLGQGPPWLPRTFNLQTELPQFIRHYQQRQERGEDNHWICKPWNLARALDTHITSNLDYIIRQRESTPKVVCKYLEDPVLFDREEIGLVKFDIRYMVLLRSVQPLCLYAYHVFWLRFANRPFSLDLFDDYQKHFTVMNYAEGAQLKQVHYDEFIPMFEKQYPQYPWKQVERDIFKAFSELFQAASSRPAPYGICPYPSSRAIYAIDLMLKWEKSEEGERVMQPQILEVNFNPDCARACLYHPSFYDHMFQTLFLDQAHQCPVTQII
ncbi:tubulin--tyrosine ligase-like protein 12 [Electrophorus electricus]|uniref:tubulin--tyrosine ligase-like protein 12 n=1 Tax=Electrophorus electricus TaxID=8005 RepID=UPI0015CF9FC2|nr:tubulin--tyrosine ligase-like protein 12 [Electrophorus electricus]